MKKIPVRNPGPLHTGAGKGRGGEGIKGFLQLKEEERGKRREGREGGEGKRRREEGPASGGSCSKVLGRIDAPAYNFFASGPKFT